ncbi:MAG: hypothetical protein ABS63_00080 [Microbacterium sp. SCN 70-27]|uniref:RNA polymerase sigma factor n=1 Tax=unclassified Microbacterium TaxID=2609290 RepID=UPI00086A7F14|nr:MULTISPECIES: sigma-70 family RNA polymerase sigma factor [unclassified Microbacterium]MBN9224263.1 sigma-70 family RNA polymerase sigma factor [Microbacterium sp.]ODT29338.1 MAG: hypothetical protein ABS63_00080 [Microbacterium sp. SCN 70-27]
MATTDDEFAALYRGTKSTVWRYARRRVTSDEIADDVCSEVFEIAFRKLPRDHPHPIGWLIQAASISLKQAARGEERRRKAARDHAIVHESYEPDARLEELDAAWKALSAAHREVLQLIIWDKLAAADAALVLGCSEQAIWKRVSRARQALRDAWPDPQATRREETSHESRSTTAQR